MRVGQYFRMSRRVPPPQYEALTAGVRIRVRPKFMHDESEPSEGKFIWAYTVDVENETEQTWTIVRRHWHIVDAAGRTQLVEGEGVIGQTPTIEPGERFSYTSGAPLSAPSGIMSGAYDMKSDTGEMLVAVIPAFSLDSPYETALPS